MGGLKVEIADEIWMFKPKKLKETISLEQMRDEQINKEVHTTSIVELCAYHHHSSKSFYPNSNTQEIELGWNVKTESTKALFQLQQQIHPKT